MSQRIRELWAQKVSDGSASRDYIFIDFDSVVAVDGRIKAFATPTPGSLETEIPYYYGGLPIKLPCSITEQGGRIFMVTADYGAQNGPEAGYTGPGTAEAPDHGNGSESTPLSSEISYEISGATQHITQSIKTRQSVHRDPAFVPRNFKQAIGVKGLEVEGCDKYVADIKWSIDFTLPAALCTAALARTIENRASLMNLDTFFGYKPGELLLMEGSLKSDGASGTFKGHLGFGVKHNQAIIDVSEDIQLLDVKGWDYVWCTYADEPQDIGGQTIMRRVPNEAYVEQIYQEIDFEDLGLKNRRRKP